MWRLDRLKMSEWYSDGMGVVLGTYKRGRRWAGGMTHLATREVQWPCMGQRAEASSWGEMYYGVGI